jgi:hypothetical protein
MIGEPFSIMVNRLIIGTRLAMLMLTSFDTKIVNGFNPLSIADVLANKTPQLEQDLGGTMASLSPRAGCIFWWCQCSSPEQGVCYLGIESRGHSIGRVSFLDMAWSQLR